MKFVNFYIIFLSGFSIIYLTRLFIFDSRIIFCEYNMIVVNEWR